jgi:hypothetical protein
VEFKPAYGHIFKDYLPASTYSHWGYSDLDTVFGDVHSWITPDELADFDVVTYSHGDQDSVYLRGQFTFHKNTEFASNLWRPCKYLSEIGSRYHLLASDPKAPKWRFESAEGCYSHAVLTNPTVSVKYAPRASEASAKKNEEQPVAAVHRRPSSFCASGAGGKSGRAPKRPKLPCSRFARVRSLRSPPISSFYARFARRYAVKAFTDFDKHDTSDKHGVLIQHLPYNCVALWKASSDPSTFEDLLASSASFSPLPPFPPPPVSPYTDTGPLVPVESYADRNTPLSNNGRGCMFWAPKTYQPQICVHDVDSTYTVTLRDGQLYKQKCVRASATQSSVCAR